MTQADQASPDVRERARDMLMAELLKHPDEGVRAIALISGPSDESIDRVAASLRAKGPGHEQ